MDQMSLQLQIPTLCWKCQTTSGVQLVMNDITLRAVHHQQHAQELMEQLEIGRIGRLRDKYEFRAATVPLSEEALPPHG